MTALLRADWLRLRRRRDLWIIGIAVCVLGGLSFLAGYRSEVADPTWLTPAEIREEVISYSDFGGMTQAEIDAQIDQWVAERIQSDAQQQVEWEAQQAISLQKYDVVQSVFTIIGNGLAPILALVLVSSLAVGDEFRHGTVRTSLLAAGNRRRFLVARFSSLVVMTVGLFGTLVLLATILAFGLRLVGAELAPTTTAIDAAASVAWLGGQVLTTLTLIALGVALTVLLRSGALPLLLILVTGLIELFVANLPIFGPTEFLSGVPQVFPGTAIRTLTSRLGLDTHAVALTGVELPQATIDLPLTVVAAIIAAWGLLFLIAADRRFRRMDIVE